MLHSCFTLAVGEPEAEFDTLSWYIEVRQQARSGWKGDRVKPLDAATYDGWDSDGLTTHHN